MPISEVINIELSDNIDKLNSFKELKSGWLGKDSEPINVKFIDISLNHIEKFLVQPFVDNFDNGISLTWAINKNDMIEINISDQIEYIVTLNDDIVYDMVIEEKFIYYYANRVLKQQLRNA